ncbi:MAG: alpha/beta hydrolase [Thermoproteota archaeon]|nr:alpha/beta hydrolase [Thermoproteota archaeon]
MSNLGFIHRFVPSPSSDKVNGKANADSKNKQQHPLTLLMLHGTGGDENDLVPLGQMLDPSAALLSPRGKVMEKGMSRFFRRLSEGVFDLDDLKFRTQELGMFLRKASSQYSFDLNNTVAVGFSNGANIAASLLLLVPETIKGAILFRAMVPFIPDNPPDLLDKKVLLSAGVFDPIVSKDQTESLLNILQKSRADVSLKWQRSGHNLTEADIIESKKWLSEKIN